MNLTHPMVSSVSAGPSTVVVMAQHHDEENNSERVAVVNADRGDHDASSLKRDPAVVAVRKPRQRSSITSIGSRPTLLMATGYHQHAKSMGECKDPSHGDNATTMTTMHSSPLFPCSPGVAGARRYPTTTKRGSLTKPMTAMMMMRQPRMRVVRTGGGGRRRSLTEEEVMQIKHAAGHGGGGVGDAGSVVSERTYPLVQSRLSASGKQLETATELVASQEELATAAAAAAPAAAVAEKEESQQEQHQEHEREDEAQINDDNDRWNNGISAHEASFFTVRRPPVVPPRPEHRNSDETPLCLDVLRQFRRISVSEETDVSALTDSFYFPSVSEFDDCSFVSSNRSLGTSSASFHFSMGGRSVSRNLQSATSLSEESTVVFECSNNDVYSIAQDSILEDDSFAVPDSPAARTEESEFLHKSQEQLDLPIPEEEDDNDDSSTVDVADDVLEQSGETKLSNALASNTSRDVQPKPPSRTLPRQEEPFRCRTLPRQNERIEKGVIVDQCDESTVALDLDNDNYSTLLDRDQEEEEEEEESSAWGEDQLELCPGKRVSQQFEQSFAYGSNENIPTFQ